ncbi:MAG: signal peptidase I [Fuerstiella sp.]|nr:signal peptidase I [Fuerstiella sp.]
MSKKKHRKHSGEVEDRSKPSKQKDGGVRETVESIAIAFALAFLFKTFQAEAYVIPTGSMAPTLYGRHKELTCPSCQFEFRVGASTELNDSTGYVRSEFRIDKTLCPNCRREVDAFHAPVFNGDRIIVSKQVTGYDRFDVVVFKNPEEGHVNYIKRLVGLPGETIRIRQGNLWMRRAEEESWQMLRKDDPATQKDIQLLVYDDRYPPRDLVDAGFHERWAPSIHSPDDPSSVSGWLESRNAWTADRVTREYTANADDDRWHWIRYRHIVPSEQDWNDAASGRIESPRASLISDYCGFNVANAADRHRGYDSFSSDVYWVGDLTINCTLDVIETATDSAIRLELIEGPDTFGCVIDPVSGNIEITQVNRLHDRDGERPKVLATAVSDIQGAGSWEISFANVDNRILLWIDGDLVKFNQPLLIHQAYGDVPLIRPGEADTVPSGIAVRNTQVIVSDLVLQRDIYYRNDAYQFSQDESFTSAGGDVTSRSQEVGSPWALHRKLEDPEAWAEHYYTEAQESHRRYGSYSEYKLNDDEYLMFGDNSPRSKDSRLFDFYNRPRWGVEGHRYAVNENDLIGKALYVFWPHGVPFLNGGQGFTVTNHKKHHYDERSGKLTGVTIDYPSYRFPFYPNLSRMKKIR